MRCRVVIGFIAVGILLGSCGGKRCGCCGKEAEVVVADSLEVRVTLNAGSYAMREPIVMTLTVRNKTDRPLNLTFPSAQRYDLIVKRGKKVVWQWSWGRMFAQARGFHSLASHDTISYEITWDQTTQDATELSLGSYTVQGILKTSPEVASQERQFFVAD